MPDLYQFITLMIFAGFVSGTLSGLFGVGGGIILVPLLDYALTYLDISSVIRMHVAIATSLSVVIFTTLSASYSHYKKDSVDMYLIKKWWIFISLGSIIGVYIASNTKSTVLAFMFSIIILISGLITLLLRKPIVLFNDIPRSSFFNTVPVVLGGVSSALGIGAGTLGVPLLVSMNYTFIKAVGTAAAFGTILSIPGTLGYIIVSMHQQLPDFGFIGYVNVLALLLILPTALFAAPLGVKIAHLIPYRMHKNLFGTLLLIIASKMFIRALSGY